MLVKTALIGYKKSNFKAMTIICSEDFMPVEIIYKNRRKGADRRKTFSTDHVPERRNGLDRRKLDEKLKQLIEDSQKHAPKEKPAQPPPPSGPVILRKKGDG